MPTSDNSRCSAQWPSHRVMAAVALAVTMVGVAAAVLLPIGWQLNRFVVWLYYFGRNTFGITFISLAGYEFLLNMALFVVPAFLAATVWPRPRWWIWPLAALVGSTAIELTQWCFLSREATWVDVASNTLGALLGVTVATRSRRLDAPSTMPLH